MEQHGKNQHNLIVAIIPARYASTRLPGKLLIEVAGKPLIIHTLQQALKAKTVDRVIVATDDQRILDAVCRFGGESVMTSHEHSTGSDRIAEGAAGLPQKTIVVNVQGDAVEAMLADPECDIVTTCEAIADISDVLSPDVVKVVVDHSGRALYFSRSPIPYPREAVIRDGSIEAALNSDSGLLSSFRKHTGMYVYRREYLLGLCKMRQSVLERSEMLEQLRAMENGAKIRVIEVVDPSIGVDNVDDLARVRRLIESDG